MFLMEIQIYVFAFHVFGLNVCVHSWIHSAVEISIRNLTKINLSKYSERSWVSQKGGYSGASESGDRR